jgi:hypothetical protein
MSDKGLWRIMNGAVVLMVLCAAALAFGWGYRLGVKHERAGTVSGLTPPVAETLAPAPLNYSPTIDGLPERYVCDAYVEHSCIAAHDPTLPKIGKPKRAAPKKMTLRSSSPHCGLGNLHIRASQRGRGVP